MTRWAMPALVGFARGAGWRKADAITAGALAMASSRGEDSYRHVAWPGPLADERGLWAIDVALVELDDAVNLYDPATCAAVAHALWRATDGSWDWSAVWRAGVGSEYVQAAREAWSGSRTPQAAAWIETPEDWHDAGRAVDAAMAAVRDTSMSVQLRSRYGPRLGG